MINIKIIYSKSIDIFNYYIKIYNSSGLISEGRTHNNKYIFNNRNLEIHKMEIYNNLIHPYYKKINFIPNKDIKIFFDSNQILTFKLIDKNYNMPVKEGIINLWKIKKK